VTGVPLEHGLMVAAALFTIGLAGLMVRRNLMFILMSLEIMLNAAGLAFIVAGTAWAEPDGQVMYLMVITLAAAEAAVALALVLQIYRRFRSLDVDALSQLRG